MNRTFQRRAAKPDRTARVDLNGGRVTGVEPQARHPNRYNLYIDDHFALGLSALVAVRVRVGQELSAQQVQALALEEQAEAAHEYALRRLETRPRSEQEIRRALAGKKFSEEIVDRVIGRLAEAGLLSDRDFAKFWVENREGFKPRSARALRYELRQKGVPPDEIARVLKHVDEQDSAYRAARPRAERWKGLAAEEFKAKLSGFLARRGFDYQVTRSTVARLWKELQGEEMGDEGEE